MSGWWVGLMYCLRWTVVGASGRCIALSKSFVTNTKSFVTTYQYKKIIVTPKGSVRLVKFGWFEEMLEEFVREKYYFE